MSRRALFTGTRIPRSLSLGLAFLSCFIVVVCTSSPLTVAYPSSARAPITFAQRLQSQLLTKMKTMKVPGAVIFIQSTKTGRWTTSLGTSNLVTRRAMKADMHFRIGSITKTFTGTVILQLADQGKLSLDDPVSKYQSNVPNGANITIRELLDMRSGLYNYSEDQNFVQQIETQPAKAWKPQDLLAIAYKHTPTSTPGQSFNYSNTNSILLGLIIEQITGQTLAQEFEQRIFTPLGMKQTFLPTSSATTLPSPYASGYLWVPATKKGKQSTTVGTLVDVTTWNPSWTWAAGAVISNVHDMAIWAKALATGQLLSSATQQARLNWSSNPTTDIKYGLAIADFSGFIGHDGGLPGYQSFAVYQPGTGTGTSANTGTTIIVLTNLQDGPDGNGTADALAGTIIKELS